MRPDCVTPATADLWTRLGATRELLRTLRDDFKSQRAEIAAVLGADAHKKLAQTEVELVRVRKERDEWRDKFHALEKKLSRLVLAMKDE